MITKFNSYSQTMWICTTFYINPLVAEANDSMSLQPTPSLRIPLLHPLHRPHMQLIPSNRPLHWNPSLTLIPCQIVCLCHAQLSSKVLLTSPFPDLTRLIPKPAYTLWVFLPSPFSLLPSCSACGCLAITLSAWGASFGEELPSWSCCKSSF